ncbi:MAG: murein hydrolase activator EnvC family protein [Magnetospiraceae bacterium]
MKARSALFLIGLMPVLAGAPAGAIEDAETAQERLRGLENSRKADADRAAALAAAAREQRAALDDLALKMITVAKAVREADSRTLALEDELTALEADAAAQENRLRTLAGQQYWVLAALQRMARRPPESLLVQPLSSEQMVRGGILLRASLPAIDERVTRFRDELAALSAARAAITRQKKVLSRMAQDRQREKDRLNALIAEKESLYSQTLAERQAAQARADRLAKDATDLRALIDALERDAALEQERLAREAAELERRQKVRAAEEARQEAAEKQRRADQIAKAEARTQKSSGIIEGATLLPVSGKVLQSFGTGSKTALTHKGIVLESVPAAAVVAPHDGKVVFAGPFRAYGQLLIIEHGHGYHTLVAGLGRIDVAVGQWVLAGEPVGEMENPEIGRPTIYVELRRDGKPIDPLPNLAKRKTKAPG